jgi:hypothetical protein
MLLKKMITAGALVATLAVVFVPATNLVAQLRASGSDVEAEPSFPYMAETTAENVHVRSGPGTNYYSCGKLSKSDIVKVVATRFSWSRIVPPEGSFCWISSQYVSKDPDKPGTGIVTGNSVHVYAGSEHLKPIHSTTMQLKLGRGDKVALLGEEQDGYYKIVPPSGAYLWVSTEYTRLVEMPPEQPEETAVPEPSPPAEPEISPPAPEPASTQTAPAAETPEASGRLAEYQKLEKQLATEREKPPAEQDYGRISKELTDISNDKTATKAARYARIALAQVKRCRLAADAARQIQLQQRQLKTATERINSAKTARLSRVRDLGKYAVIGTLQASKVFGPEKELQRFTIVDDAGKITCYAVPTGAAERVDLAGFLDRKAGLVGALEPHPQTAGALVRFTAIEALD